MQAGAPRPARLSTSTGPFGGIHVFIGKIGEPGPEPDICTDIIETAQHARPARVLPVVKRAFVGVIHGVESEDRLESGGETIVYSGDESSTGETESLYQLQDGRIGGCFGAPSEGASITEGFYINTIASPMKCE